MLLPWLKAVQKAARSRGGQQGALDILTSDIKTRYFWIEYLRGAGRSHMELGKANLMAAEAHLKAVLKEALAEA
ncbi:hypothetical protein LTR15_009599 [Elasticomyces elasticus]|nr:hypothetical protein LTR15_009599 [Elasticomyces elasticus]